MANTYLSRTQGTPTSNDIGTISCWIKRGTLDKNNEYILQNYVDANNYGYIRFKSDNQIQVYNNSLADEKRTNRLFRDTSAWYHVVLRVDTTQSTANDRVRLYINGIQETSLSTNTNGAQNANYDLFKSGGTLRIGYPSSGTAINFDGSMSHFHYCDGQSYAPTAFGEYDANGVWKIKTSPSVTYGNEGFFILKDGNSVTDQSGNSNNWTVGGGTLTNTEDSPSNVFAVINALDTTLPTANPVIISNGNTVLTGTNGTGIVGACATIAVSQGKYYFEVSRLGTADYAYVGVVKPGIGNISNITGTLPICAYRNNGSTYSNLSVGTQDTWNTDGDIIMCAMDMDNGAIYFGKNGSWLNSGNPLSGASHTGAFGSFTPNSSDYYAPLLAGYNNSTGVRANFGNGYFGTTAVASAGTNASGIGIFEYDVPTGYTALSTKGLNL
jgi:hypothetical protein